MPNSTEYRWAARRSAEVAATIAFLCTEQSSYTSGALFAVDGGSTSQ